MKNLLTLIALSFSFALVGCNSTNEIEAAKSEDDMTAVISIANFISFVNQDAINGGTRAINVSRLCNAEAGNITVSLVNEICQRELNAYTQRDNSYTNNEDRLNAKNNFNSKAVNNFIKRNS